MQRMGCTPFSQELADGTRVTGFVCAGRMRRRRCESCGSLRRSPVRRAARRPVPEVQGDGAARLADELDAVTAEEDVDGCLGRLRDGAAGWAGRRGRG